MYYWSGKGDPITGAALLQTPSSDVSLNTSMLQAIYDDKNGLALALPPDQIVWQFEQSLQSSEGNALKLLLQIPLVLDARQSDIFPIEVYRFTLRFSGRLAAILRGASRRFQRASRTVIVRGELIARESTAPLQN